MKMFSSLRQNESHHPPPSMHVRYITATTAEMRALRVFTLFTVHLSYLQRLSELGARGPGPPVPEGPRGGVLEGPQRPHPHRRPGPAGLAAAARQRGGGGQALLGGGGIPRISVCLGGGDGIGVPTQRLVFRRNLIRVSPHFFDCITRNDVL